jgi:hypothetical protein
MPPGIVGYPTNNPGCNHFQTLTPMIAKWIPSLFVSSFFLKLTFTLFTVAEGLNLNLECPNAGGEVFLTNHQPGVQQSTSSPINKMFDAVSTSQSFIEFMF